MLTAWPWIWRHYNLSKRLYLFTRWYTVTSSKIWTFRKYHHKNLVYRSVHLPTLSYRRPFPPKIWYPTTKLLSTDNEMIPARNAMDEHAQNRGEWRAATTHPEGIRTLHSITMCYTQSLNNTKHTVYIYRMSQEECARLRKGVPYVKLYRYNPKHLCPNLNSYGDNGQRKVWSSGGSTHCTCQLTTLSMLHRWVWYHMTAIQLKLAINCICTSFRVMKYSAMLRQCWTVRCHA